MGIKKIQELVALEFFFNLSVFTNSIYPKNYFYFNIKEKDKKDIIPIYKSLESRVSPYLLLSQAY